VSTPPTPLNPDTLPDNDNVPGNHYAYCRRLDGQLFMQTGRMIAYYPGAARAGHPVRAAHRGQRRRLRRPALLRPALHRRLGGRHRRRAPAARRPRLRHQLLQPEQGNLTLRAANLLAFDATLELKQSIVPASSP
jgi:hypothetical protein